MQTLLIRDTHQLVAKLQQNGFSAQQAEGITQALRELDATELTTKHDLQELKVDLIKWMVGTQLAYGAIVVTVLVGLLKSADRQDLFPISVFCAKCQGGRILL